MQNESISLAEKLIMCVFKSYILLKYFKIIYANCQMGLLFRRKDCGFVVEHLLEMQKILDSTPPLRHHHL